MAQPPHDYWQHLFLHTAGLPTNSANIHFLGGWEIYRSSVGDYNRIDLSQREPGSTRASKLPNGRYARNYTDTASAANAFADQLNLTDYPELRKALASGDPMHYKGADGVALNLQKWGAVRWQVEYLAEHGIVAVGGSSGQGKPTSKNVGGAWSHLMKVLARDGHRTIVELEKATADLTRIERRLRRA